MSMIKGIISLSIGVVILSGVFITTVKGVNTTPCLNASLCDINSNWSTAEIALFSLLTTIGIAGLVYGTASVFGLA